MNSMTSDTPLFWQRLLVRYLEVCREMDAGPQTISADMLSDGLDALSSNQETTRASERVKGQPCQEVVPLHL